MVFPLFFCPSTTPFRMRITLLAQPCAIHDVVHEKAAPAHLPLCPRSDGVPTFAIVVAIMAKVCGPLVHSLH
jgi:hypothetical protein